MARLGINIDHVATVRQARRTFEPDPVRAAHEAELGGADQITVHLREDRRHIQPRDLRLLRETVATRLNLEMACAEEIVSIACELRPDQATLVPEKREEVTTEGGLDAARSAERLSPVIDRLAEAGIAVSLFIDPEELQIETARELGAAGVELHTGRYAEAFLRRGPEGTRASAEALAELVSASRLAANAKLSVAAGHGLTYVNVGAVASINEVEEFNIGHSIVSRAVFVGLREAVREMKALVSGGRR